MIIKVHGCFIGENRFSFCDLSCDLYRCLIGGNVAQRNCRPELNFKSYRNIDCNRVVRKISTKSVYGIDKEVELSST